MANQRPTTEGRLRLVMPDGSAALPELRQTVVHALGSRGDVVRAASVIAAIERDGHFRQVIVHAGRPDDGAISDELRADPGVPPPDHWLRATGGAFGERMSAMLAGFEEVLSAERPEVAVVYGGGNTGLACSLAAAKQGVALAHVEAGLRCDGPDAGDDLNRLLIDRLADTLLAASQDAGSNLLAEGVPDTRVHVIGSPSIDVLRRHESGARRRATWRGRGLAQGEYVVVVLQRAANLAGARGAAVQAGVTALCDAVPVACCLPSWAEIEATAPITLRSPRYADFLSLLAGAGAVVTDSGAVQDEACALGVPCRTLAAATERRETLKHAMNDVLGDDPAAIAAVRPSGMAPTPAAVPLWDGRAGDRAADVLVAHYALQRVD
jgi:UDP-N-acetylglucosamine 2-epimerase (non-hydrolysing)